MNLAIGRILVRKEHHAELAYDGVKGAVRERQRGGISGLEVHLFTRPELRARYLKHRWIEISRRQVRVRRQDVAQLACDNPGTRGDLQHAFRVAGGRSARNVGGVVGEDHRTQAAVVVLRNIANEACRIVRR